MYESLKTNNRTLAKRKHVLS